MIDLIIPGYNCRKTLKNCLDSVCLQSCKKLINVVFVDDCSLENYDDILGEYSEVLNIKYLQSDINRGPGYCRQLGLDNSGSEFVMFLDADDLLADTDSVELLYESIKNDLDYVYSLVYFESGDFVSSNAGDLHGKMYRRKFLQKHKISFRDSRLHEDNLFNSLVLLHGARAVDVLAVTYLYLRHSSSITNSISGLSELSLKEYVKNISFVTERFADYDVVNPAVNDYLDAKYSYLKSLYRLGGDDSKKLITELLDSYRLKPLE